jgi:hypothetical protein
VRAWIVAASLLVLTFLFPGTASAAGRLGVEAFVVGPADSAEAVVTVRNLGTAPADVVSVELRQGRKPIGARQGTRLAPGQASVFRFAVGSGAYGRGRLYVLVSRRMGTVIDATAVAVAPPRAQGGHGIGSTVVTTMFSVGSLLVGIFVTDFLTRRRERSQSRLEARRNDVERDAPAYRAFIVDWQGSIAPAHLKSAFADLLGAAGVPERVQDVYRETLDRLGDPAATDEAKHQAAKRLRRAVEELTRTPSLD